MKKIEITTSQNVTIEYTLGSVWERFFAFSLDLLILGSSSFLVGAALTAMLGSDDADIVIYILILPWVVFYTPAWEFLNNGVTPGKRVLSLRVIRIDGEPPHFQDYLMRWVFRALEIYLTLGSVAVFSVISSSYGQRLGDLLANTVVVNTGKTNRLQFSSFMKLNKKSNYKPVYPQVLKMPEEAMLIVKLTLSRDLELNNEPHRLALTELANKMEKELEIKAPKDKKKFLSDLLSDYVMLTR